MPDLTVICKDVKFIDFVSVCTAVPRGQQGEKEGHGCGDAHSLLGCGPRHVRGSPRSVVRPARYGRRGEGTPQADHSTRPARGTKCSVVTAGDML